MISDLQIHFLFWLLPQRRYKQWYFVVDLVWVTRSLSCDHLGRIWSIWARQTVLSTFTVFWVRTTLLKYCDLTSELSSNLGLNAWEKLLQQLRIENRISNRYWIKVIYELSSKWSYSENKIHVVLSWGLHLKAMPLDPYCFLYMLRICHCKYSMDPCCNILMILV